MSMVIELRQGISNGGFSIKEIMRNAYTMARLLELKEVMQWLNYEMKGYKENMMIPDYRNVEGEFHKNILQTSYNSGFAENAKKIEHPKDYNHYICELSVYELETLSQNDRTIKGHNNYTKSFQDSNPYILIRTIKIQNMLEQIKDKILSFALDLETQEILGDNKTFTQEEKSKASNITINVLGDWKDSPITTGTDSTQQTNYNTNKLQGE